MTTAVEFFVQQLLEEGVRWVFGNPGSTEAPFTEHLARHSELEYVLTLHEPAALAAAEGYVWAAQEPALVALHITPGLGSGMGMLYNAHRNGSPLVVYCGQLSDHAGTRDPMLSGDLLAWARPVTKMAVEARVADDLALLVHRAFNAAWAPPRGPVLLSVPVDVMRREARGGIRLRMAPLQPPEPPRSQVDKVASFLAHVESPVIIAGDLMAGPEGEQALAKLAQSSRAAIISAYSTRSPFPSGHDSLISDINFVDDELLRQQLADFDLVLALGCPYLRVLRPVLEDAPHQPLARLVHIHIDPTELDKTYPTDVAVFGDPVTAARQIAERLDEILQSEGGSFRQGHREGPSQHVRGAKRVEAEVVASADTMAASSFAETFAASLRPDTVVYEEALSVSGALARSLRRHGIGPVFRSIGGTLGAGIGGPIGLKLALPNRAVVAVVGDGSAMYGIQGLWTAAHQGLPIVWVVVNNGGYDVLKTRARLEGADDAGFAAFDFTNPAIDFVAVARGLGIEAERVSDAAGLRDGIVRAQERSTAGLIDCLVGPSSMQTVT